MSSRDTTAPPLVVPKPSRDGKYDPQSEAAFRRAVQGAFDVLTAQRSVPAVASLDFVFDPTDDKLYLKVVAAANVRSVRFQIADNADFTSPEVNEVVNMTEGDVVTRSTSALGTSDRDKVWYARATPYSGPNGGGSAGVAVEDTEFVPLIEVFGYVRETFSETASQATLTLVPFATAVFDEVRTATQVGNAAMSSFAAVTADGSGNYVTTVDLIEKHPSKIAYRVYRDGDIVQENVVTFDVGTGANVTSLSVSYDGEETATVTANFDSDTDTGASKAEYRVDGGSWTALTVSADRVADFTVAQSTSAEKVVQVRGLNTAGTAGEWREVIVEKFIPVPVAFPVLAEVRAQEWDAGNCAVPEDASVKITWETFGDTTGYEIGIYRFDADGDRTGLTLSASPGAGEYEDVLSNFEQDIGGGAAITYTYQVLLIRDSDSITVSGLYTNPLTVYLTACP